MYRQHERHFEGVIIDYFLYSLLIVVFMDMGAPRVLEPSLYLNVEVVSVNSLPEQYKNANNYW